MQIFIMRHGEASFDAASDMQRPLTPRGVEQCLAIGQMLKSELGSVERVLVSPYLRAEQTLDNIKQCLSVEQVEVITELVPGGDAQIVADYIGMLADKNINSILVVSHLPLVGYLVSELCPGVFSPMFSTASLVHIQFNKQNMKGVLKSMITPGC